MRRLIAFTCGVLWAAVMLVTLSAPASAQVDLKTMAQLSWKFNMVRIEDNAAIDFYVAIFDCKRYLKDNHNDIVWQKVREATREYIRTNKDNFSDTVTITQPIFFDAYDFDQGGFPLLPQSQYNKVSRIFLSQNSTIIPECNANLKNVGPYYLNGIATLKMPFHLLFVPIPQTKAQEFLDMKAQETRAQQALSMADDEKGRDAYLEMTIKLDTALPPLKIQYKEFAQFQGKLVSYRVYGDVAKTMLLYEREYKK